MTVQERIDSGLIDKRFQKDCREASVEELEKDYPCLKGFIHNINWWENNVRVAILKSISDPSSYCLRLFSHLHEYSIYIRPDWIGAGLSNRFCEPLEDWHRGRDLPDGPCSRDTFKKILYAILACELIPYDDGSRVPQDIPEDSD